MHKSRSTEIPRKFKRREQLSPSERAPTHAEGSSIPDVGDVLQLLMRDNLFDTTLY